VTVAFLFFGAGCATADPVYVPPLRTPKPGRTLVLPRAQMKYSLGRNYVRQWVDRPLFQDTSLRSASGDFVTPYASYERVVDTVRSYGLDGLAFLPETVRRMGMFELTDRVGAEGFRLLPEFIAVDDLEAKRAVLNAALKCKGVVRIDGRIPITAYRTDFLELEKWRTLLAALRREHGDAFIFLPDLSQPGGRPWRHWNKERDARGGTLPAESEDRIKQYLRSYLEVFDGLYFAATAGIKTADRKFDADFYLNVLIRLYREVLAEPGHEGKYFGLSAFIGHQNCTRIGYGHSEDGTKTLRRSLETAMAAQPDLIVLPEWDEQNENTSIRPTVCNSLSTQRIIKYCMHKIKGQAPAPNPGDDLSLPNLVISYRKILTLGERLEVELLNVPDSDSQERYEATLTLHDLNGEPVAAFPGLKFRADRLEDRTVSVPSEDWADHTVLVPAVTVKRGGTQLRFQRGLHHILLRATWNWDYKWVKTPLRDLCRPVDAEFTMSPGTDGEWVARGRVECNEDIAAVEVLENDAVVYAVSPAAAALRDRGEDVMLCIELRSFKREKLSGTITVRDSTCVWPKSWNKPLRDVHVQGATLTFGAEESVDWRPRLLFVALPRASAAQARLDFDLDRFKISVPVQRLLERRIYSEVRDVGATLTVSLYHKQPDHPLHLGRRRVEFAARVLPEMAASVFHLRVIAKSGRIYRGEPRVLPEATGGEAVPLTVYSDTRQAPVTVRVDARRVPDIVYPLTPDCGAALCTEAGRPFWAHLGGFADPVTGRGGDGGWDGTPFVHLANYPKTARRSAPTWVREDGSDCLKFAAPGQFIGFPQGVLPRRGSFTLSFEIKPLSDRPQILFTHHGKSVGSLTVRLVAGKLKGMFVGERLEKFLFAPGLAVGTGKWSLIEIVYDLAGMRFRVNGKESPVMTCRGPGLYDTTSAFGGFRTEWFEGFLRSLRIRHSSLPAPAR